MTAQQPPAPPKRRRTFLLLAIAVAAIVAVIVALIVDANRFEYDEAAHQRVIEAYGVDVSDWDAYRDVVQEACELEEDGFELLVRQETDLGRLQLDIEYACPDRMDEFTEITGYPPLD